jgi:hypothetical protein
MHMGFPVMMVLMSVVAMAAVDGSISNLCLIDRLVKFCEYSLSFWFPEQ